MKFQKIDALAQMISLQVLHKIFGGSPESFLPGLKRLQVEAAYSERRAHGKLYRVDFDSESIVMRFWLRSTDALVTRKFEGPLIIRLHKGAREHIRFIPNFHFEMTPEERVTQNAFLEKNFNDALAKGMSPVDLATMVNVQSLLLIRRVRFTERQADTPRIYFTDVSVHDHAVRATMVIQLSDREIKQWKAALEAYDRRIVGEFVTNRSEMRALCDEFGAIPVVTLKQRLMPLCLIKPSDIDFYWNNQEPPEDTGQLILKLPSGVKLMN